MTDAVDDRDRGYTDRLSLIDGTAPIEVDPSGPSTYRPALVKLIRDLRELRGELVEGFPSRRDVLVWSQRLTIRTLGELPQRYYREIGRQFRLSDARGGEEGVLLAALLDPAARRRDLSETLLEDGELREDVRERYPDLEGVPSIELEAALVESIRGRLAARMVRPALDRAFRTLRSSATEYVDEAGEGDAHDPRAQRHVAMRPGLSELDEWQDDALRMCLDGLDDQEAILDWGDVVEIATNGELNETAVAGRLEGDLVERCYREPSAVWLLTSDGEAAARGRELFAATYLLPAFNLAVREEVNRAKEAPDADRSPQEATPI